MRSYANRILVTALRLGWRMCGWYCELGEYVCHYPSDHLRDVVYRAVAYLCADARVGLVGDCASDGDGRAADCGRDYRERGCGGRVVVHSHFRNDWKGRARAI